MHKKNKVERSKGIQSNQQFFTIMFIITTLTIKTAFTIINKRIFVRLSRAHAYKVTITLLLYFSYKKIKKKKKNRKVKKKINECYCIVFSYIPQSFRSDLCLSLLLSVDTSKLTSLMIRVHLIRLEAFRFVLACTHQSIHHLMYLVCCALLNFLSIMFSINVIHFPLSFFNLDNLLIRF